VTTSTFFDNWKNRGLFTISTIAADGDLPEQAASQMNKNRQDHRLFDGLACLDYKL